MRSKFIMLALFLSSLFASNPTASWGQCTDGCGDISALNCSNIVVSIPYNLYFTGYEKGMRDGANQQTGFTMVQPHSENRLTQDGAPTCPAIIGYEPSKLMLSENNLSLTASKGIAFLDPPASSNNNNQVNTLGVGLQVNNQKFDVETTLLKVNTGAGSAQAGIWYGLDEDNFVKLVVVDNNKIELRVESAGLSTPIMTRTLNVASFINKDIRVKLSFDFSGASKTVSGFYQVGADAEVSMGTALAVPTSFGQGISLATGIDGVSYAGVFASYRNGNIFTAKFDDFSITDPTWNDLFFSLELVNETIQQNTSKTFSLVASSSDATNQIVSLSASYNGTVPTWLTVGGQQLDGTVTHNIAEPEIVFQINGLGLPLGNYTVLVKATSPGYNEAFFLLSLVVNEVGGVPLANFKVNFQDVFTNPPTGYLADFGEQYGFRTGANQGIGMAYGWLREDNGVTPLSLQGKGRKRNTPADLAQATFMHMQPVGSDFGVWEAQVPNGAYQVTVSVGDGGGFTDSQHAINVEGVKLILPFVPTPGQIKSGTAVVNVIDGRLTMDALGGTNTKVNYIWIEPAPGAQRPFVLNTNIAEGATNVDLNISISTTGLSLPNGGLDNSTVIPGNIILKRIIGNQTITINVNGTGGGDAITLVPTQPLEANTLYQLDITENVKDVSGEKLIPYSIQFVTGNGSGGDQSIPGVTFTKVDLGNDAKGMHTTLTVGPDNKLYATSVDGRIKRFVINPDGTLGPVEILTPFGAEQRLLISLEFDPAAREDSLVAWISYSKVPTFNQESNAPDWDGVVARVSGPNLENLQIVVENLPRSLRDHVVNSLNFGPDGNLYIPVSGNSAMGLGDAAWGNRQERLLSAAILKLDISKLPANLPLNVKTSEGGTYDPFAPNAPLTFYATGLRNVYDLVWHSNGELYAPSNGSAAGGNSPTSDPNNPRYIAPNPNVLYNGADSIPAALNIQPTQPDWLFRIESGGYYGHPNPQRAEYIVGRGDFEVANPIYDGINPDPNYRKASFAFGVNQSPNGIIEYRSNAFGGLLRGKLMVTRFSQNDDIIILEPGGVNKDIIASYVDPLGTAGFRGFNDPLDLIEDTHTGNIYVSEFGENNPNGKITLLRANVPATPSGELVISPEELIDNVVVGSTGIAQTITLKNVGNAPLTLDTIQVIGQDLDAFVLNNLPASFPVVLAAKDSIKIDVAFAPTSQGIKLAQLEVQTDNLLNPIKHISLRGLGTAGLGGNNEPSLQAILDLYQYAIHIGDNNASSNQINIEATSTYNDLLGDEISIQRFQKASAGPITIEPLSVFGPTTSNPVVRFGWYNSENAAPLNQLFTVSNSPTTNGQTVNPVISGTTSFELDFNVPFGFYSQWPFFANRTLYSEDDLNTFSGAVPHHVRIYPLKNSEGEIIPNAYVLATEEHISGFDYQDIVVIVRNVEPYEDPTPPALAFEEEVYLLSLGQDQSTFINLDLNQINITPASISVTLTAIDDTTGVVPTWITPVASNWGQAFTLNPADPAINWAIDANGLPLGNYSATITASTPSGLQSATLQIRLTIVDAAQELPELYVNFQDQTTAPPDGWLKDFGEPYGERNGVNQGTGLKYGWVSLSDRTPLSLVGNGRNRNTSAIGEALLDATFMHMQYNGSSGVPAIGVWEVEVPNGYYDVTVTVGDINATDSQHSINVEGISLINKFAPTASQKLLTATTTTLISDGKVTLDPQGGTNTKIIKTSIKPTPLKLIFDQTALEIHLPFGSHIDTLTAILSANLGIGEGLSLEQSIGSSWLTLPGFPTLGNINFIVNSAGLTPGTYEATVEAKGKDYQSASIQIILRVEGIALSFNPDTLNFSVEQGGTTPNQITNLVAVNGNPAIHLSKRTEDAWLILPTDPAVGSMPFGVNVGGLAPGNYSTVVTASAPGYNNTKLVVNLMITPKASVFNYKYKINFQRNTTATTPTGYIPDIGNAFGSRGVFNGENLTFGWVNALYGEPFSNVNNMRERTTGLSLELRTLGQMQVSGSEANWRMLLPNQFYGIRIAVGDTEFKNNVNVVNAEGQNIVTYDQIALNQLGNKISETALEINDGDLLVDAIGGTNTKINYIWVGELEAANDNVPPVITVDLEGIEVSPGIYRDQVLVKINARDLGKAGLSSVEFKVNEGAWQTYSNDFVIENPGEYTLQVRAADTRGNQALTPVYAFEVGNPPLNNTLMVLENLDKFPENDELSFSRLQIPWANQPTQVNGVNVFPVNGNHDLVTLRIYNRGLTNLRIDDIVMSNGNYWKIVKINNFAFDPSTTFPMLIVPGKNVDVLFQFIAVDPPGARSGLVKVLHETATIYSNDDTTPIKEIKLHGLWQKEGEGFNEPNINEIIDAFGLKTTTGFIVTKSSQDSTETADERYVRFFRRADLNKPIYVRHLAAYHGCCVQTESLRYEATDPTNKKGGVQATFQIGLDGQTILPRRNTNAVNGIYGDPSEGSFSVNTPMSFTVLNDCTNSYLNFPSADNPADQGYIGMRTWLLRNSRGEIVPNKFLIANDYLTADANNDYNDNLFLLENVVPYPGSSFSSELATGNGVIGDPDEKQSSLEFAETLTGSVSTKTLHIRSLGQTYPGGESDPILEITGLEIIGDHQAEFEADLPLDQFLDPQEATTIEVRFRPTEVGLKNAILLIYYNNGNSPTRVPLFGLAGAACYDISLEKHIKTARPDANTVIINGQTWESDIPYRDGSGFQLDALSDVTTEIFETDKDQLYRSYMSSNADLKSIAYKINLPNGRYHLRLHFVEKFFSAANQRVNNILIEGETRIVGLDTYREVGNNTALVKDLLVDVEDGVLNIQFNPTVNRPAIAGIEVYGFEPNGVLNLEATQINHSDCGVANGSILVALSGETNPRYKLGIVGEYQSSGLFQNLAPGTYKIYAKGDNLDCEIFNTFTVEQNQANIDFTLGVIPLSCNSINDGAATITNITGGVSPYSIIWNNNPETTGNLVTGLTVSNIHFVTITDASGCSKTVNFAINRDPDCDIRINAGGVDYIDTHGNLFIADQYFLNGSTSARSDAIGNTEDDGLYQVYRFSNSTDVDYAIPVSAGNYQLRLHFAEIFNNGAGLRTFNIEAEGQRLQSNFDIFVEAGGRFIALIKEFDIPITDGTLNLKFDLIQTPLIAAIEVIKENNQPNNPPYLQTPLADQNGEVFQNFEFVIPQNTFLDPNPGDILTLSATLKDGAALPGWLVFDQDNNRFQGVPQPADAGKISVKVIATDQQGETVSDIFDITIMNSSLTVDQINLPLFVGADNKPILKIGIEEQPGALLTAMTFLTTGTTNTIDIQRAKLFYTANNENFINPIQLGADALRPSGDFTITGFNQTLASGINYFWLTYDVSDTATLGNLLDAEIVLIRIDGEDNAPGVAGNPNGARQITEPDCQAGTGLSFQGINGMASVASGVGMPTTLTLEAWVYPRQNTNNRWIVGEVGGAHIRQNGALYEFYIHDGNALIGPATAPVYLNKWTHLTAVYDDASNKLLLYVNGRVGTTFTFAGGANIDQNGEFAFGSDNPAMPPNNIIIDEVRLWNVARSVTEIRQNMRLAAEGNETGLVNYWQVNEGSGLISRDLVGDALVNLNASSWEAALQSMSCGSSLSSATSTVASRSTSKNAKSGTDITYIYDLPETTLKITFVGGIAPAEDSLVVNELIGPPTNRPSNGFDVVDVYYAIDNFDPTVPSFAPIQMEITLKNESLPTGNPSAFLLQKRDEDGATIWNTLSNSPLLNPFVTVAADENNEEVSFKGEPGNSTLTAFGVAPFYHSDFLLNTSFDPLPISLLSFEGRRLNEKQVLLNWITASEINNKGFQIQKSVDALNFENISFIDGAGNSNTILEYQFLDKNAASSAYYRLQQIDLDGTSEFSSIVFVEGFDQNFLSIFPNPVVEAQSIEFQASENIQNQSDIRAELVDTRGQILLQITGSLDEIKDAVKQQIPGLGRSVYILKVFTDQKLYTLKLVKN
ncbi:MAG: malectin domain-containing carbohydrate-binding protein [Microscillaceae bacterium]|nr:malectin domain-containing carbohydrate-binding protein [Microscillaceae bacterium]